MTPQDARMVDGGTAPALASSVGRTVEAVRGQARRRLPKGLFEFIDRGTEDEIALSGNREAFDRIELRPRVLVDVSGRSTESELLGRSISIPLAIAPTGAAGLVWFRGEIELARAATAMGVPFTLATRSMSSIETIAAEAGGILWFQLYASADTDLSFALIERASKAGLCGADDDRRYTHHAAS